MTDSKFQILENSSFYRSIHLFLYASNEYLCVTQYGDHIHSPSKVFFWRDPQIFVLLTQILFVLMALYSCAAFTIVSYQCTDVVYE